MSDTETTTWRNLSGHPEDLSGGRIVETGGFVDLSADEAKDPFNKAKLEENFVQVKEPDEQAQEEQAFDRDEALKRAKELGISGYTRMRNDELKTAIIEAEEKEGSG